MAGDDKDSSDGDGWGDFAANKTSTTPAVTPAVAPAVAPAAAPPVASGELPAKPDSDAVRTPKSKPSKKAPEARAPQPPARTHKAATGSPNKPPPKTSRSPKKKPSDTPSKPKRLRLWIGLAVITGIGSCAGAGYINHNRFYIACEETVAEARRGSRFPWGTSELDGARWKPFEIGAEAECVGAEVASEAVLVEEFANRLLAEVNRRVVSGTAEGIETAKAQIVQALVLTRGNRDQRGRLEQLRGDVDHLQATLELKHAYERIERAADLFKTAAERVPLHAKDSAKWATFSQELSEKVERGIAAQKRQTSPTPVPSTTAEAATSEPVNLPPKPSADAGPTLTTQDAAPTTAVIDAAAPASKPGTKMPAKPAANPSAPRGGVLL